MDLQAAPVLTGFMKRRARLAYFREAGSCPNKYRSELRIRSSLAQGTKSPPPNHASALIKHKEKLQSLKNTPLPPVKTPYPRIFKELPLMNTAVAAHELEELNPEQLADLRENLRVLLEEDKSFTQGRLAREAEISGTTLSQFLGGTYGGSLQNVGRKLANWLRARAERNSAGTLPQGPEWVRTPTSEKIKGGLQYAQMAADIVVICGGAGLGKTKTIQRFASANNNVWHVELTPATGSVLTCLQEIAYAMGLRDLTNSAAYMQRAIWTKARDTGGLLVLDEAQHLTIQALDQVRAINDQVKIGLVLCGNERIYQQMTGGNRAPFLDRLYSRVGKKIVLRKVVKGDAEAIMEAWGIEDTPCREQIRQIADTPGALRVLNKVLRMAAIYASAKKKPICCDSVKAAAAELGVL